MDIELAITSLNTYKFNPQYSEYFDDTYVDVV